MTEPLRTTEGVAAAPAAAETPAPAPAPAPQAWYAGATEWEQIAAAFVRSELYRQAPDFAGFAERIAPFGREVVHGAWIRVAQEAPTQLGRTRAYLEALTASPFHDSLAWYWLSGQFDLSDQVLHVVEADDPWTPETVARERERLGSIVDEGGAPPVTLEVVGESLEDARREAAQRFGAAFSAAIESVVCEPDEAAVEEASAETPGAALHEIERSLPPGSEVLSNNLIEASTTRRVVVSGGERPKLEPNEHIAGQRLVARAEKGFLGFGKKPGRYELTVATSATVRVTYRRKAVLRYTLYRRSLLKSA